MAKLKLGIFLNVMPHHPAPAERSSAPTSAPKPQMALKTTRGREGGREALRAAGTSVRETKSARQDETFCPFPN